MLNEITRYLICGGITTLSSFLAYVFFTRGLGLYLLVGNVLAWTVGVLVAFYLNRKVVFQNNDKRVVHQFLKFVLARVSSLGAESFLLWYGVERLLLHDLPVKICVQVLVIIMNYIMSKKIVFSLKPRER